MAVARMIFALMQKCRRFEFQTSVGLAILFSARVLAGQCTQRDTNQNAQDGDNQGFSGWSAVCARRYSDTRLGSYGPSATAFGNMPTCLIADRERLYLIRMQWDRDASGRAIGHMTRERELWSVRKADGERRVIRMRPVPSNNGHITLGRNFIVWKDGGSWGNSHDIEQFDLIDTVHGTVVASGGLQRGGWGANPVTASATAYQLLLRELEPSPWPKADIEDDSEIVVTGLKQWGFQENARRWAFIFPGIRAWWGATVLGRDPGGRILIALAIEVVSKCQEGFVLRLSPSGEVCLLCEVKPPVSWSDNSGGFSHVVLDSETGEVWQVWSDMTSVWLRRWYE